ncbi:MAG: PQQ-like beta-propeller repeat protein [Sedimentisphaerales bacterium]|nr:PQQ-like beta-propeller repeat protein [Sedimentisphaerales bacterium]
MRRNIWAIVVLAGLVVSQAMGDSEDWTHLGRDAARQSTAVDGPNVADASTLAWEAATDPQDASRQVEFEGSTGPVLYAGTVFAYARCVEEPNSQVAAWDADSGLLLWSARIDPSRDGSSSTPCVDTKHNAVLIGSGSRVFALDANDGTAVWKSPTQLDGPVVNASLCTALDLPHARAFITDTSYGTDDGQGHLYCINLDANEPNNPYEPGEVLWRCDLGGTLGNSPSYLHGRLYVATSDARVYAFDANATSEPNEPVWAAPGLDSTGADSQSPIVGQFWGGVTVTADGFLYAATYNYSLATGQNNSTLVKIDCNDGRIVWTTAVERTDTIPVAVGDMVFVSGGLPGDFNSKPKVQAFRDLGDRAQLVWDTAADLPEMAIGGWTAQPAYASGKLYVGAQDQPYDALWRPNGNNYLYVLDVTRRPSEAGFVISLVEGCGNSPIVTRDSVYSAGPNALMKFHQP